MNTMYEILVSLWELIGAALLPDYIDKILYYLSLIMVVLILFSPLILIYIIIWFVRGSMGGYRG